MAQETLEQLSAADLMQRDMVTVAPQESLRDALSLMTENHVTGLPVMDDHDRCIGLITATDILTYEQDHDETEPSDHMVQHFNSELQQWESVPTGAFGLEEFGDVRVEEVMTTDLVWVERDTPLKDIAQRMIDARVHRVLVMDSHCRLYGVISSFDFVRVLAEP
jgi:CBS-domain-containing membrane protein